MKAAFLTLLDSSLQNDIPNYSRLVENSLKLTFLYNPQVYVIDSHVIDNKPFRKRCLNSDAQMRKFLKEKFDNKPPLTVGLRKGTKNLFEVLEDILAIDKKAEEPVEFVSLTPAENDKIMKLHKEGSLTLKKFFEIAQNSITEQELEEIDQFLSNNGLYIETLQTHTQYKEAVIGTCRILKESEPHDHYGKALQFLANRFLSNGKDTIFEADRFRRSYGYRTLKSLQNVIPLDLKCLFKRLVLDYTYNITIAIHTDLKFHLHGDVFSCPFKFLAKHNVQLKDQYYYKIEKVEESQFAAQLDKLNYDEILTIRERRKDDLIKLQDTKDNQDYLNSYTKNVLCDMKRMGILQRISSSKKRVKYMRITEILDKLNWLEIGGGLASLGLILLSQYSFLPNEFGGYEVYLGTMGLGLTLAPLVASRLMSSDRESKQFEINLKKSYKNIVSSK